LLDISQIYKSTEAESLIAQNAFKFYNNVAKHYFSNINHYEYQYYNYMIRISYIQTLLLFMYINIIFICKYASTFCSIRIYLHNIIQYN